MSDDRLLPCQWCQSVELTAVQFQGRGYIRCLTCGAQGPATAVSITEARAAWNRRASGWQPIETAPRNRKMVALIAPYPNSGREWTDPWNSWWDEKAREWPRWPHPFPPTMWAPLPAAPEARHD
jgi:hypothetical protein